MRQTLYDKYMYLKRRTDKKLLAALLLLFFVPLCAESLRESNKIYFDSIQWEELGDRAVAPLPEAFTIEDGKPIPYADSIEDGGVYPSLPELGVLDYQNIPEDMLVLYDKIAAGILIKKLDRTLFDANKPFLPYLTQFMLDRLPVCSHAFFARPSMSRKDSASALFRLLPKKADETEPTAPELPPEDTVEQPTAVQQLPAVRETAPALSADEIHLFSNKSPPAAIMLEVAALRQDNTWKIAYIDIKGIEYAASDLTD